MEGDGSNSARREFSEIGALLPSFVEAGILSEIESRIVASSSQLNDRQAAVYRLLVSKYRDEPEIMTELLKRLALRTQPNQDEIIGMDEEACSSPLQTPANNPLLNNSVIKYVYGFLCLNDIKNCRFVNQQWNRIAEPLLRKRATIHFSPESLLRPSTFLEIFQLSLPGCPFSSFIISEDCLLSELNEFFIKWGSKIKRLDLLEIHLTTVENEQDGLGTYDVSHWMGYASGLQKLRIISRHWHTKLEIASEKLELVTHLVLERCRIVIGTSQNEYIKPVLCLINVHLVELKQDGKNTTFRFNDLFDFSAAVEIVLHYYTSDNTFDMASQVLNVHKLVLIGIQVLNWEEAAGNVSFCYLRKCNILEKNQLEIKELRTESSLTDLCALPSGIEKLHFGPNSQIISHEAIIFPNLNYLFFWADIVYDQNDHISHFLDCKNLSELEFDCASSIHWTLNCHMIPKSVKKLKISANHFKIENVDNYILKLDVLILNDCVGRLFTKVSDTLLKIEPKVLVVSWCGVCDINTNDVVSFVLKKPHVEKFIIGSNEDLNLHKNNPFECSILSRFVKKIKSNHYQFEIENEEGTPLTTEEFKSWSSLQGLEERHEL